MRDSLYENVPFSLSELKHFYGPNVHLVGNPYLLSLLASLCAKDTQQPAVNTLVRALYSDLITMVVNHEFPRRQVTIPSRMIQYTPRGIYQGEILDPEVRAISVNIARANSFTSLTERACPGQDGSTFAAARPLSQDGQNSRKRYQRP